MSDHLPVAMGEKDPGSQPQRVRRRNNDRAFVVFMFMLSAWFFWPWADMISYFEDIKTHTQSPQSCEAGALAGSETEFDWASVSIIAVVYSLSGFWTLSYRFERLLPVQNSSGRNVLTTRSARG